MFLNAVPGLERDKHCRKILAVSCLFLVVSQHFGTWVLAVNNVKGTRAIDLCVQGLFWGCVLLSSFQSLCGWCRH